VDVTGDSYATPIDVLRVINDLNLNGPRCLLVAPTESGLFDSFTLLTIQGIGSSNKVEKGESQHDAEFPIISANRTRWSPIRSEQISRQSLPSSDRYRFAERLFDEDDDEELSWDNPRSIEMNLIISDIVEAIAVLNSI
jgi:hypothetical protein